MQSLIINIHGFLSSHESEKILQLRDYIASNSKDIDFISPQLPNTPKAAVALIESIIVESEGVYDNIALIGHSLGGYFATYIASKSGLKSVLVNPVVRAYEIMCEFFGQCYNPHTGEFFEITAQDIEYLISINVEPMADTRLFLVLQQLGDEIISPESTLAHYQGCATVVEPGGCHDFSGLVHHADTMLEFLFAR